MCFIFRRRVKTDPGVASLGVRSRPPLTPFAMNTARQVLPTLRDMCHDDATTRCQVAPTICSTNGR
jgi:hypothetical protein